MNFSLHLDITLSYNKVITPKLVDYYSVFFYYSVKHFSRKFSSWQHFAYNPRWQHHFTMPIRGWSLMTPHDVMYARGVVYFQSALSTA